MVARQRRYEPSEFARRGDEIFDRDIRPGLQANDQDKIVAIDIESGDWEMDPSEVAACDRLQSRRRDAQIWIVRVGSRYVRRFGAGKSRKHP